MSDTIFNGQGTPAPAPQSTGGAATPPAASSNEPFADLLGSIKNERGEPKYKDLPTALEALRHSQEFIPQVKQERDELERKYREAQEQLNRMAELEATVARLTSATQTPPVTQKDALDAEAVAKLVTETLTAREREAIQKANTQKVVSTLQEVFGAEAEKVFYSKAKELGLSAQQVNALAAESPLAVLNLYGVTADKVKAPSSPAMPAPTSGSVNTSGYQPTPQSYISKNPKSAILGATTNELRQENDNARKLVEELHSKGMSTYDLSDPKQYFKLFQ